MTVGVGAWVLVRPGWVTSPCDVIVTPVCTLGGGRVGVDRGGGLGPSVSRARAREVSCAGDGVCAGQCLTRKNFFLCCVFGLSLALARAYASA